MLGLNNSIWTPGLGVETLAAKAAKVLQSHGLVQHDYSNLGALFSDTGGTTAAAVDGVVGNVSDLSGNGRDAVASSDGARPSLRLAGGKYSLDFDGANDELLTTKGAGAWSSATVIMGLKTSDALWVALNPSTSSSTYLGIAQANTLTILSANAGSPTFLVDGAAITLTRQGFLDATSDGSPHVLEMTSADLTHADWASFTSSQSPFGFNFDGDQYCLFILDGTESAEDRALVVEYAAELSGATLN